MLEKINNSLDLNNRLANPCSDNLYIYKARVYRTLGPNDDRLQVRILPFMADIPKDELDNLPKYPSFFSGQVIAAYSEVKDGKKNASIVLVAATSDFTCGYVLGLANQWEGNIKAKFTRSYNFKSIKRFLTQRGVCPASFDYQDIMVEINIGNEKTGGCLRFYNIRTGDYFIVNKSGCIITVQQDKIYMRAGSPPSIPGTKVNFSQITLTPTEIKFDTPLFNVNAKNLILGRHGLYLQGTNAEVSAAVDMTSNVPIKNIMV